MERWAKRNIAGFARVLPRDEFPREELAPGRSWIINLDRGDYERGGTHWVCARVASKKPYVFYIDSFGLPPPREVTLSAWKVGRGVLRSNTQYQDFHEENCGPRALAYLQQMATARDDEAAFRAISA